MSFADRLNQFVDRPPIMPRTSADRERSVHRSTPRTLGNSKSRGPSTDRASQSGNLGMGSGMPGSGNRLVKNDSTGSMKSNTSGHAQTGRKRFPEAQNRGGLRGGAAPQPASERKTSGKRIVHGRASPLNVQHSVNDQVAIGHANVAEMSMKKGKVKVVNDSNGATYGFNYSNCGGGFNFEEGVHPLFRDQTRDGIGSNAINYHDAKKCAKKHFNPDKVKIDLSNHAEEKYTGCRPKFTLGSKTARGRVETRGLSSIECLVSDKGGPPDCTGGRARSSLDMPATKCSVGNLFKHDQ